LLAAKGFYYAMWRQQVGERRLEPAQVQTGSEGAAQRFS
jgi:hypothetical protein